MKFISEVPVRIRPSLPLAWIVTSRLEKYRAATEDWLANNDIKYEHLIMLDLPHKQSRLVSNCHASFKASMYKEISTDIFIESSLKQAIEIARLAGKCVICFETQECVFPGMKAEMAHEVKDIVKVYKRRFRSKLKRLYKTWMEPQVTFLDARKT